ncbi:UNVERIFIED_CONTAM: MtaA/CmuA family methyltransferase [Clostridioides difficile]|uniref:MtaA/CmuA family methyltransferase n=1 Tax=Clostridioides difficile TaxID=1496 RepID=UPI0008264D88|nr:MtaA/CmuA family methyltransferase [Clostridioides difficile]MDO0136280.1 MtaA/CmuA family methyltransferase [Clostridioides difficile]MDX5649347.1 MtaA/CmuA family methyltransferase [Clostridioides difficile]HBG7259463.1 MtaA/CmuA family methyltransferase [Clostridioides difficile]HBY2627061.1 MtaA/CmuA family methyltransferase [Clostridioides difficile]HBY3615735.1 MtaA/CmuA family methyltransferase [Clostridioides difficile]
MNKKITSSLLLERSLKHKSVSRQPCICPGGMMNMMTMEIMDIAEAWWPEAHTDPRVMAKLAEASYQNNLFDNIGVPFCMTVEAESMGAGVDLGSASIEPRVIEYAIASVDEWEKLKKLSIEDGRTKVVLDAIRIIKEEHPDAAIMGNLTGPISLASSLVEATQFYKDLRKNPKGSEKVMDIVVESLIWFGKAQIEAGAEFITISDPSGTGEILGPNLFENYALPALNKICRELKPLCKGIIVHICGQLKSIYKQILSLECDAISVDAVVNLKQLRERVPGKVIMGNVSTFALASGDKKIIHKLCRNCIENGADILAPACGLGTTTTIDSIKIMMETSKENMEEI